MTDEDTILIGEGVVLDSGAASVPLRMLSGLIDLTVSVLVLVAAYAMLENVLAGVNDAWARALSILVMVAVLVIAPILVETLTRGRSLGRWAVGLRIVRDDGGPVSVRHAAARALVGVFEVYMTLGMLAVTVSALGSRGKRIGDYLAGTYAMRTRGARRALPPLTMPPALAAWALTADITRLPDGLALTARMFLGRAGTMHAPSRARIGTQLSTRFATHVAPLPPAGTHPEDFLAAVLVARRDREHAVEAARMSRAARDAARLTALPYGIPDVD
ncbi:RDD family protein [Demequina subtropica]|uniref:RDD family protein n=1 Tax=Demequina subtropica TaxID=1638989 RepID=UPI000783FC70|nr:RDD family protein [Demequina subtropica]